MATTSRKSGNRRPLPQSSLAARVARSRELYLLLLLPLAYMLLFQYYPMYGAQIAFKDFKANLGILRSPWVGFKHFIRLFESYQFGRVVRNTLVLASYSLIAAFVCRVILALMVNAVPSAFYRRSVQMVTYMPHFISTVVIVGMLTQFLNPRLGFISRLIQALGGTDRDLLGVPRAFAHLYVWSGIWQNVGWGTIVFLAALASVDPCLHEAAIIDGAGRLRRILHVDLPAIVPTAVILLILDAGRIMNVGFEKTYLMQNNLNLSASEVIATYVYKMGIGGSGAIRTDFSFGAAIGLFNSLVNFVLVIAVNRVSRALSQTSLW